MENDLIQDTNLDLLQVQVASVEYSGQAPINVDNQQYIISLDQSALSSKLDTSAFDEWTATHTGGQEYSAGDGIDITDHIISVTGQLTGDYLTKSSADTLYQPIGDYLTTADSGNFYPMEGNPSGFLTGVDLSNYYEKNETSSKQEIGDVINEINNNITNLSGKYYPLTSNPSGYLTAHQDVSNKLDVTAFTAYTATAKGTEYSAGDNINITNHVISGKDWSAEIENATTGKLDATAFNSGDFYPMTGNPSGFLTGVDLTPYQEKTGMTAYQPVGDYYSASNPSGFITGVDLSNYYQKNETSSKEEISAALTGKLDESAFTAYTATAVQGVEYSGIAPIDVNNTTHQISADVWTLSGASGISILEDNENKVTTIACTAVPDLSNYYTKTDTSSKQEISAAITGKQDNLTFAYNVNSAISSINGSALAGGNSEDTIDLSAGEGISIVETGDKVLISCTVTGGAIPTQVVANSGLATGQNILYVVTGS